MLENSIKYGDNGRDIKIIAEADSQVLIHVENSGQRISNKHRDKIFQRFYRVDKSRDRKAGGTGLGLAIVKKIVEEHGGVLNLEDSTPFENGDIVGASVSINLPKSKKQSD